jgi:hypothetical protein
MKTPIRTIAIAGAIAGAILLGGAACTSKADTASENLSTAAENFEVQRSIVGVNGITDKVAFYVEGRCSIERVDGQLEVTCKEGENDLRKHFVGLSDNIFYVVTQLDAVDADEYRTRVIIKPESLIPAFDIETSNQ